MARNGACRYPGKTAYPSFPESSIFRWCRGGRIELPTSPWSRYCALLRHLAKSNSAFAPCNVAVDHGISTRVSIFDLDGSSERRFQGVPVHDSIKSLVAKAERRWLSATTFSTSWKAGSRRYLDLKSDPELSVSLAGIDTNTWIPANGMWPAALEMA
jgi:hypothetical protein